MGDLSASLTRWGHATVFLSVVLGSVGVPIPEDGVFALAGYLAWEGRLSLPGVMVVGVLAAMAGDNLGYWIGRRLGHVAVKRAVPCARVPRPRVAQVRRLVARYGAASVFLARFVNGARLLAGPLAGSAGLPPLTFLGANTLGALVPLSRSWLVSGTPSARVSATSWSACASGWVRSGLPLSLQRLSGRSGSSGDRSYGKEWDNSQSLQYMGAVEPICSGGRCTVCHLQAMPENLHHE